MGSRLLKAKHFNNTGRENKGYLVMFIQNSWPEFRIIQDFSELLLAWVNKMVVIEFRTKEN